MSDIEFKIKSDDLDKVIDSIEKFPANAENAINEYFKDTAAPMANRSIINLLPVSERNKKHAKDSNPFKNEFTNLGFAVKSKDAFYYLYFPDQGKGTSREAMNFMENGLNKQYDNIIDGIVNMLDL